jgi:alcohol dehydrogenase class IV
MATNEGELLDYLEVIGKGKALEQPSLPWIAIPSTAGTGAEVTRNAVLESGEHRVKVSLRSPGMLARLALVDPELTYDLPGSITASSGMDALSQLIEPFVSNKANPLTDAFCREGIPRAAGSLRRAYENGGDKNARRNMALASLLGGLALANAKLGAVHGFAGVLGGMYGGPHGAICARLLPPVMQVNLKALQERDPQNPAVGRYAEIAKLLTGKTDPRVEDGIAWVLALVQDLNIPPLSTFGLETGDFPAVIEKSAVSSSMQGNPIKLSYTELELILDLAI